MSLTNEQYKKIILFLDAEMEPEEMDAFEEELAANPEMRAQLDFEQSVRNNFAQQHITNPADTIPSKKNAATATTTGKITSMRNWMAIGAAVITACILITVLWKKPATGPDITKANGIDTTDKKRNPIPIAVNVPAKDSSKPIDLTLLFKQYFKKDALPEDYPLFLAEAFLDYESGKYTTLQQLDLSQLPQTRGEMKAGSEETILRLAHYYKGIAFLQTNNAKDALISLNWVLKNNPEKAMLTKTQWYLALAYLKENDSTRATELFNKIISENENPIWVKNAKRIVDAIGK
ncbi:MAG TPA: hypothetical protein PKV73_08235 [Agriterribacter sp.]|nr:hypothetical protein [Agriterribacter sp.]